MFRVHNSSNFPLIFPLTTNRDRSIFLLLVLLVAKETHQHNLYPFEAQNEKVGIPEDDLVKPPRGLLYRFGGFILCRKIELLLT